MARSVTRLSARCPRNHTRWAVSCCACHYAHLTARHVSGQESLHPSSTSRSTEGYGLQPSRWQRETPAVSASSVQPEWRSTTGHDEGRADRSARPSSCPSLSRRQLHQVRCHDHVVTFLPPGDDLVSQASQRRTVTEHHKGAGALQAGEQHVVDAYPGMPARKLLVDVLRLPGASHRTPPCTPRDGPECARVNHRGTRSAACRACTRYLPDFSAEGNGAWSRRVPG